MSVLKLNAKNKNTFTFEYAGNLTDKQIIFRIKRNVEDTTAPLVEVLGVISTVGATSAGYFNVDLTAETLKGEYYCEFEINDAASINGTPTNAPAFFDITKCLIQTRLDN